MMRLLIPLLIACLGLQACSDVNRTADLQTDTLIVAVGGDAQSLDPHIVTDAGSMRMIENLYSSLLRYDDDVQNIGLAADLAESWAWSEDGRTLTLTLVEDATFHSGNPVDAAAVEASLARIRGAGSRAGHLSSIEDIQTPDERTVVLRLSRPDAALLTHLAHPMNAIVDPAVLDEAGGDLSATVAGSGPYQLVEHRTGSAMQLSAFDGYHREGLPRTPNLTYRVITDPTARSAAIRSGEVHVLHEVSSSDAAILERAQGVTLVQTPGTFWEYLGLNTQAAPLDDPAVRRAVAWSVDRDALNQAIKFGRSEPIPGGPMPAGHWAAADDPVYPRRDVQRARQLLADAGHGDGVSFELIVDADQTDQVRAAEMVKQQLADAGIDVQVRGVEAAVFYDRLNRGGFQATLVGLIGQVDPDELMRQSFHSRGIYNQQGFASPDVDDMIDAAATSTDQAERAVQYRAIQQAVADQAPLVFLYRNPHTSAIRESVSGYRVHPTATTRGLVSATID
jgi:peptide/nickel transport system substrate-binding protein